MSATRSDDEALPWLEAVEDEDEPPAVSARKMLAALALVLLGVAIVAGTVIGNWLYGWTWSKEMGLVLLWPAGAVLVGVAVVGWLASLSIQPLPAANERLRFPKNPVVQTWVDLAAIGQSRPLFRCAIGIAQCVIHYSRHRTCVQPRHLWP